MMRGTVLGPDDSRLTRYLLGELPEDEQTRLEEEYFNSPDALEKLAAAEDELIDDYVDGRLEGDRRTRFEQRLATSPQGWQRVEFARQLGRYVASRVEPAPARAFRPFASPIGQLAMAAALLLAIGATGWMALERRELRRELARVEDERRSLAARAQALTAMVDEARRAADARSRQPSVESQAPLPTAEPPRQQPTPVVALSLLPGLTRSPGAVNRVTLSSTAAVLRLELQLPPAAQPSYRVLVETARGREVWTQDRVAPRQRGAATALVVDVPARVLDAGDYVVVASSEAAAGAGDASSYAFSVVKPEP